MAEDAELKKGTCSWCGDEGDIYSDNCRCEDCDNKVVHCAICNDDYDEDSKCRHIFKNQDYEWDGSGITWQTSTDCVLTSLRKIIGAMPSGFADDLRTAIQSGKFYTWMIAPIIGGGGMFELNGMPRRNGKYMVQEWGDHLLKLGERDDAEEMADGYRWLVSLYEDKTSVANAMTIDWINSWITERRDDTLAVARMADDGCRNIDMKGADR